MSIPIERTTSARLDAPMVASHDLTNVPADHMFMAEYANGEWKSARIHKYQPIPMAPLALGLHYAQIVFEGMKAYKMQGDKIGVFRTGRHHERFNRSLVRMCMPEVPLQLFADAIHTLVDVDKDWVPPGPDAAYYIRPFVIASEERMGLKSADEFLFMVVGGPFRPLYQKPLRVKVERVYTRAAHGGTGFAKCAGNYAAAMYPTKLAQQEGFDQVIWTDARDHAFVEESGTMNLAFVINGAVVTPPVSDTILDGVTRDTMLTIARDLGLQVEERPVSVEELHAGLKSGTVTEAFGVGTAASIAPIQTISVDGEDLHLSISPDKMMFTLKKHLDDIRYGIIPDEKGWMNIIGGVAT
ncbi:MAG: branched-chain amino acid aminotransferase [Candidatus Kapabacteria bacterium]|nr:branched-chain amino acid aminotransferase [Candidatus Kapabacteria bacterium]